MKLAERYQIAEVVFDPWRAAVIVKAFETRGIKTTVWPWTDSRVIPAANQLYEAICRRQAHPHRRCRARQAHGDGGRQVHPARPADRQGQRDRSDRRGLRLADGLRKRNGSRAPSLRSWSGGSDGRLVLHRLPYAHPERVALLPASRRSPLEPEPGTNRERASSAPRCSSATATSARRCGSPERLEVHHLVAAADGGSDDPANLTHVLRGLPPPSMRTERDLAFRPFVNDCSGRSRTAP